jgi:hypothetical protein
MRFLEFGEVEKNLDMLYMEIFLPYVVQTVKEK